MAHRLTGAGVRSLARLDPWRLRYSMQRNSSLDLVGTFREHITILTARREVRGRTGAKRTSIFRAKSASNISAVGWSSAGSGAHRPTGGWSGFTAAQPGSPVTEELDRRG